MMNKENVFDSAAGMLKEKGFNVVSKDGKRPWGGFFVIDEEQAVKFIRAFFPGMKPEEFSSFEKLSPKILLVEPGKRLSWQYHFRRAEIWRVIEGSVGVVVSETDQQAPMKRLKAGDSIRLKQGERHRLVGLDNWGTVAEIWQHTDPDHPSDEDDIVRLADDFGR
jgi:mannose-6-phosphate isomerase